MRSLIRKMEEASHIGYRPKEHYDRKLQRHIESSVVELKALAKKGVGGDVAAREEKIFQALLDEMRKQPFAFLASLLNVLGAGTDYKKSVMGTQK